MSKYQSYISPHEEIYEHVGNLNDLIIHSLSGITNPDPNYEIIRPDADCFSIEYILEGEGIVQENDQFFAVKKGDFFILHPGTNHCYYSSKTNPWKKIWLYVANEGYHISTLLNIYNIEKNVIFPNINSPLNLESIFNTHKNEPNDFSSKLELDLYELIMRLSYSLKKKPEKNTTLHLAKWYINQNIKTKLTVEDVSNFVGLTPPYFSQSFKNEYGITPSQYILKKKIILAKHLLVTSSYSISEISEILHFSDTSHFTRTFQFFSERTPSSYRTYFRGQQKQHNTDF